MVFSMAFLDDVLKLSTKAGIQIEGDQNNRHIAFSLFCLLFRFSQFIELSYCRWLEDFKVSEFVEGN